MNNSQSILQPHLSEIVHQCINYAITLHEPLNYFYLLRALFRSIGGGKFDLLAKEFQPLLHPLLSGLNKIFVRTRFNLVKLN